MLSASRVRDVHAILPGALDLAARWNYVPFNAAVLARLPAPRNAARTLPTPEQAKALLAAAGQRDPEFELFVRLGAATGLRRGEVVALRWRDLDLDGAELSVSGNVLFLRGLAGGFVRQGPKSEHGQRLVALDARTVELLRAHRARRATNALAAGVALAEDAYLFTRVVDGARPIRPDAMTQRFHGWPRAWATTTPCTAYDTSWPPSSARSSKPRRYGHAWPRQPGGVQHLHPRRQRRRPRRRRAHGAAPRRGVVPVRLQPDQPKGCMVYAIACNAHLTLATCADSNTLRIRGGQADRACPGPFPDRNDRVASSRGPC